MASGVLGRGVAALSGLAILLSLAAGSAGAQQKVLHWERYDVELSVEADGGLLIEEDQLLAFDSGFFRYGVRSIAHQRLASLEVISVGDGESEYHLASGEAPGSYSVSRVGSTTDVRYFFPPGGPGQQRRIVIRYRVRGALRSYPDQGVDQLDWKAIPAGNPFPTHASTLSVRAPEGAALTRVGLQGWSGRSELAEGASFGRVILEAPIPAGREVELVAEWPRGFASFAEPAWQKELDRRAAEDAERDRRRPLMTLLFLSLGALLGIGGPVASYVLWHERGRDPEVGLIAEELRQPPSELRPGLVGCLIDERADLRDVVATMMDLARRGHFRILETQDRGFLGLFRSKDYELIATWTPPPDAQSEQLLLTGLLGTDPSRKLSELRNSFHVVLPKVKAALMAEATEAGLFVENPSTVRQRWGCGAAATLILGGFLCLAVAVLNAAATSATWALPFGWALAGLSFVVAAVLMPRKTREGAEELARWLAFQRYLKRARKWRDSELDPARVDRWLPYAIAFGLDRDLLSAFEQSPAAAPTWWSNGRAPNVSGPRGGGSISAPGGGGGGLSGASANMGSSLGAMSAGLGAMLASTSSTLVSSPSSGAGGSGGGGGFSGGGGSFGGGSGGGGSSFG